MQRREGTAPGRQGTGRCWRVTAGAGAGGTGSEVVPGGEPRRLRRGASQKGGACASVPAGPRSPRLGPAAMAAVAPECGVNRGACRRPRRTRRDHHLTGGTSAAITCPIAAPTPQSSLDPRSVGCSCQAKFGVCSASAQTPDSAALAVNYGARAQWLARQRGAHGAIPSKTTGRAQQPVAALRPLRRRITPTVTVLGYLSSHAFGSR